MADGYQLINPALPYSAADIEKMMARLKRFGEHVDDHQLSLARRLDAIGLVKLVEEPEELPRAVARDVAAPSRLLPAHRLSDELRSYLAAEIGTVPRAPVAHV